MQLFALTDREPGMFAIAKRLWQGIKAHAGSRTGLTISGPPINRRQDAFERTYDPVNLGVDFLGRVSRRMVRTRPSAVGRRNGHDLVGGQLGSVHETDSIPFNGNRFQTGSALAFHWEELKRET
jgi:hypothetical protein